MAAVLGRPSLLHRRCVACACASASLPLLPRAIYTYTHPHAARRCYSTSHLRGCHAQGPPPPRPTAHLRSSHHTPYRTRVWSDIHRRPTSSTSGPRQAEKRPVQEAKGRRSRDVVHDGANPAAGAGQTVRERVKSSLTNLTPHENIYNIPNFLTVSRLVAAPVTAWLLVHDHHKYALALFAYAGITDLLDGWLARRFNLQTVAGSVIDPMADKALMIILTVTLAVKGAIPLYLATLILGRDATLAVAAIYYRYASLPAPKTLLRYWDFSLPSAEVHPTTVSKYNTFLQLLLIGSALALPVVTAGGQYAGLLQHVGLSDAALLQAMRYYQWLVAGTTTWSGLSYAYLPNAVTILGADEALKAKQGARGRAIIGVTFGGVVAAAVFLALTVDEEIPLSEADARDTE